MTTQELQEKINLYQRVMDGCGKTEDFSIVNALRGETPSQAFLDFQALVEKAGLSTNFFDNAEPLYTRAEKKRNLYQKWLEEKRLFQNGISVA